MSSCTYSFLGKVLSAEQLVKKIREELLAHENDDTYSAIKDYLYKTNTVLNYADKIDKISAESKDKNSGNGWIGVSLYMELKHDLNQTSPRHIFPIYNENARIENTMASLQALKRIIEQNQQYEISNGSSLTEAEMRKMVEEQVKDEQMCSRVGTVFHDIVGNIITDGENSEAVTKALERARTELETKDKNTGKYIAEIVSGQGRNPLPTQKILDILYDRAKQAANKIKSSFGDDAIFKSEVKISAEGPAPCVDDDNKPYNPKGIQGRADLIVIHKDDNGNPKISIIDFKVGTSEFDNWCAAKRYHTEYQLGFYRAICAAHGIPGSSIDLYTAPVFMPIKTGSIEDMEVEPLRNMIAMTSNTTNVPRLSWWPAGSFTENISSMLYTPMQAENENTSELFPEIAESLLKLITYNPDTRTYGKEEFMERFVFPEKKNGKTMWVFINPLDGKKKSFATKEEYTEEGGYIDQYNLQLKELKNKQILQITKEIEQCRQEKTYEPSKGFLQTKDRHKGQDIVLRNALGIFTEEDYREVKYDVLKDFGILAYENIKNGTLRFVVVTDQILNAVVDNHGLTTVLGNFLENDEVRQLKGINALAANCANMELMKAMHVINMLYDKYPDDFLNRSFGSIEVINPGFGERVIGNVDDLKANYGFLCASTNTVNHFQSDFKTLDVWQACLFELRKVCSDYDKDDYLKDIVQTVNVGAISKREKIALLTQAIKLMKQRYPKLRYKDLKNARNFDITDPVDMVYLTLCFTNNYYLGVKIGYSGKISHWGLRAGELTRLLLLPIINNQSNTDKSGYTINGVLVGTETSSPQTVPSQTLRDLYQLYDIAYSNVRTEYAQARAVIDRITSDYIKNRVSNAWRIFVGLDYNMWENLMEKDPDGKLSKSLRLRNPYVDKALSLEDGDFIKAILWEINKYKLNLPPELKKLNYLDNALEIDNLLNAGENHLLNRAYSTGTYFDLPLRRASDFQRLRNVGRVGIKNFFLKRLETLKDEYDPRLLHNSRSEQLKEVDNDPMSMYNTYDIDQVSRKKMIEAEGVDDFEVDLDFLASDVAFLSIRQQYFEEVLVTSDTVATAMHFMQNTTDVDFSTELEAEDDQTKILRGRNLVKDELKDVVKGVGIAKRMNSLLVLSCRPLQFIKELTFGQITNYSRAWALKYSSNAISVASVFHANKVIWGQSGRKYGNAFRGEGDIADYTMCEALNKVYGFAAEDLHRTVENSTQSRFGFLSNTSRWMYIANSAPDYFNRLTLFVAKMMEDGCFEAHSLNADGTLNYDFTKDQRFSELKLDDKGEIIKPTTEKGRELLGLYRAMAEEFEREGQTIITYDSLGEHLKPIPKAYTTKLRNSIKEVADLAYGFYDHEAKSLLDHKFIGLVWKQFMTFWSAKVLLWFRGMPVNLGDNTSQGKFVHATLNGEKLYRVIRELPNGTFELWDVPESLLTEEQKLTCEPVYKWLGDYVEGIMYSILGTLHDLFHFRFKDAFSNKVRRANLLLGLHDILVGVLLFNLLKLLFSGGTGKTSNINPAVRPLLRAMQDVGPQSIASIQLVPGWVTTLGHLGQDIFNLLLPGDSGEIKAMKTNVAALTDFIWEDIVE